ncbi:hypothetical protein OC842_007378 [Tilletia horrida]|uniref:Uncharacterized protein n=1 Tax=Tilletia horrida TaxID=155126 RepID=A0AAN6G499_9BASI|nr:hypothetical protein OC842_007378 [Tilletia horrida]
MPRVLAELQTQVDSLDEVKAQYYHEVIESEEEVWEFILSKVSLMVRSQLEVSERIASKGSSDPVQRLAWLNFAGYRDRQRARSGRPTQARPAPAACGPARRASPVPQVPQHAVRGLPSRAAGTQHGPVF